MAGKRKADPKTAVKSKAAKAKAAAATDEAGKPSRETTSGFLTSLKYKACTARAMTRSMPSSCSRPAGFWVWGFVLLAGLRCRFGAWSLVVLCFVFGGLSLGVGCWDIPNIYIYIYMVLYTLYIYIYIHTHYNMLYML